MQRAAQFLEDLENSIRDEARVGWEGVRKRWDRPLGERVESGRAIGPLELLESEATGPAMLWHFEASVEDVSLFREGDKVRVSRNAPEGGMEGTFHGLTEKGLTLAVSWGADFEKGGGWTIDETHIDISEFYLRALEELAQGVSGPDVLPVLMGQVEGEVDFDAHAEASDALGREGELNESQTDAVANCLAAERFHLVQGPPGTGKTHALARLVEALVDRGERVLVTAFTHRAIHHALRMIRKRVDCPVFKVSDPFPYDGEGIEFHDRFAATGLLADEGPYVLGITPISLFTSRAADARFDSAVIDETSQMKVEAAMMPMLRAKRWFFFGDDKQLPPVVQRAVEDPAAESVFVSLKRGDNSTMLRESYRLNDLLVRWPSENFYGGDLEAHEVNGGHRFALKVMGGRKNLLGPEPAMVGVEIDHAGCRARSDEEAEVVTGLVREMLAGGLPGGEIGVVVPFRAQAARLRRLFQSGRFRDLPGVGEVVVDTVERFQGQEREAMLVSFAVSDPDFIERLRAFLLFPQRLNVAVTRARTKVVLVYSRVFREWVEKAAEWDPDGAGPAASLFEALGCVERIGDAGE